MPLNSKGQKILSSMRGTYGSEKKAKSVFYASINSGKLKDVEGRAEGGRISDRYPIRSITVPRDITAIGRHQLPQIAGPVGPAIGARFLSTIRPTSQTATTRLPQRGTTRLTPAEQKYFSGLLNDKMTRSDLLAEVPSLNLEGSRLTYDRSHAGHLENWIDADRANMRGVERLPPSFYQYGERGFGRRIETPPEGVRVVPNPYEGLPESGPFKFAEGGSTPLPRPRPLDADAEDEISVRMHKPQSWERFAGPALRAPYGGNGPPITRAPYGSTRSPLDIPRDTPEIKLASGGQAPSAPWFERNAAQGMRRTGMLNSMVPGRTDKLPINVGPGSYVVPADIVSAVGQGNSMAGSNILGRMFKPKSANLGLKGRKRAGRMFMADGGAAEDVPIVAAGGEFVISPEEVAAVGDGDVNKGHQILDDFVKATRKNHIKTLRKLPPPKKD